MDIKRRRPAVRGNACAGGPLRTPDGCASGDCRSIGRARSPVFPGVFRDLELPVGKGRTYRGRIISLEGHIDPMGGGSMVKVHRLAKIDRENVILPAKTLAVLDHNITGFMTAREQLKTLRFQARKGLLFYAQRQR